MLALILQIIISLALITVIILQAKGTGLGAGFGNSTNYHTRRGIEKTLFSATIILAVAFIVLAIVNAF